MIIDEAWSKPNLNELYESSLDEVKKELLMRNDSGNQMAILECKNLIELEELLKGLKMYNDIFVD